MSPELTSETVQYAAFKLRFRALVIDAVICTGLFLIGAILAGIAFEGNAGARVVTFGILLAVILGYEPLMVAHYGGTFGHRRSNIRIVSSRDQGNLPFWRAAVRSVLKSTLGIPSFIFMFATNRAQSLHDLAAGARVIIRDPLAASEDDSFAPVGSRIRKVVVIVIYNIGLLIALSVIKQLAVSPGCANTNICSDFEIIILQIAVLIWLALAGLSIILGSKNWLPGITAGHLGDR